MNAAVGADERLVVMLEARISDFEKRMKQAEGTGTRTYTGLRRNSRSATRQMEEDMARAGRSMNQTLASISGNIGTFGKGLLGGIAGGLAVGGLAELAAGAARLVKGIAEVGDEAKRAGLSAKAFQEWKFVADQNRVSVDALVDGFKELSLRADELIVTGVGPAAEAFTRLGYSATDLKAKLNDPSKLMAEILDRLEGFDKAAQIRIADEIFGGTGGEQFVQLLGQGQGAIQATIDSAYEAGAVMDEQMIDRAAELDRKFTELKTSAANFGKGVVVALAEAAIEAADFRARLDELFPNEAKGRDVVGDEIYDALERDRDLVDETAETVQHLTAEYRILGQEAINTANRLSDFAAELDRAGYSEQAATIRDYADGLRETAQEYASGSIDAEEFSGKIQQVQSDAETAFAALQDIDGVSFAGARAEISGLGGVIAGVISLANSLGGALQRAAGLDAATRRSNAADRKMQVEQESLDRQEAQTAANDKFTESERARNAATSEAIRLERELDAVRKRAADMGATLTDDQAQELALASIAGEDARREGGKGGSSRGKSGGGAAKQDREAARQNSRIDALINDLQTEREILEEWYAESQELLEGASEAQLEALGGRHEAAERLEAEHKKRLKNIDEAANAASLQGVLGVGADILGALGATNKKALKISQSFAAAEAWVSTIKGAAKELEKGVFGFATAAAVIAKGVAFVAAIKGTSESSQGSVSGGGSSTANEAQPSPAPLDVRLTGLTADSIISGADLGALLNRLDQEAGDRGYRLLTR